MNASLLLDANVSWRSATVLKNHFGDCVHVDGTGLSCPAKDWEIWDYAKEQELVIVTNDEDFLHLSTLRGFPPKVLLLRTGNQSRKFIEHLLISLKHQIEMFLESSEYGVLEVI